MSAVVDTPGRTQIQLTWTDLSNITRCIFVNGDEFEANLQNRKFSLAQPILTLPFMRDEPVIPVMNTSITFFPDPEYPPLPLPWLDGAALCFGKFYENGHPSPYCPRSFLAKQAMKLEEAKLQVTVGFELEFFFLKSDGTPLNTAAFGDTKAVHGKPWKVLSKIVSALEACKVPVWRYHSESGPGQFEISIGPLTGSAVRAADSLVLAREAIYHVAAEYDLKVTFVPKPFQGELASGAHTHLSIHTSKGENLFQVHPGDGNSFLGGILENLSNILLILAPTGNSYERLVPSHWSGAFQCMGVDNKEAAMRVLKQGETIERFELKTPDGTANPYLLLGSLIGAGLEGIKNRCSLPLEVNVDPGTLPVEKQPQRLPSSLPEAITCFESNEFNRELYGGGLHDLIVALRKKENEYWETTPQDEKMNMLLQRY